MAVLELEEELQTVTKCKPRRDSEEAGGPSRNGYLQRLMDVIAGIPEKDWEALSPAAQKWYNEGAKAIKEQKPIPDFANGEDAGEDDAEDEPEDTEEEEAQLEAADTEATKKKTSKSKAKGKASPKTTKAKSKGNGTAPAEKVEKVAAKGPKPAAPLKADAVKVRIKRAILKDPQISLEDLMAQLSKGGTKVSKVTTSGVRSEFRHSLRVLREAGLIDIDL